MTGKAKNILFDSIFPNNRFLIKTTNMILLIMFSSILLMSCSDSETKAVKWVSTWSTAQQLVEPHNMPPQPGLTNSTLRQVVHVSIGGDSLRMSFSNKFSTKPVTMKSVHIAASTGADSIDTTTDIALNFSGKPDVTIEPGGEVISDVFPFSLKPLQNVAITIYFGETSPDVTGHPGSRTTSYLHEGNLVSSVNIPDTNRTDHWYVIDRIDVLAPETTSAIAILGNSITDGRGSGTNKQNRWPDELSRRLQKDPATQRIAVLNQGIGGNCVLKECLGPAGVDRFDRDILQQSGVRWLIILEGVNDIGGIQNEEDADTTAKGLIAAYSQMIVKAHKAGIKVYGGTIMPFAKSFYDKPERQKAWQEVNTWIRTSGKFDAVIDFADALKDPANPMQLLPEADDGDHLHPSQMGHHMMGEAVDLKLFQ